MGEQPVRPDVFTKLAPLLGAEQWKQFGGRMHRRSASIFGHVPDTK
jgi:hypothetical protein